jgi:hypothetical protein
VLTAADVDAALSARGLEPLYGAAGAAANNDGGAANAHAVAGGFLRASGHPDLYFAVDRELPLESAVEAPLPRVPRDAGVAFHWLAVQGRQPCTADNAPCFQSDYMQRRRRREQAAAAAAAVAAAGGSAADAAAAAAAVAAAGAAGGSGAGEVKAVGVGAAGGSGAGGIGSGNGGLVGSGNGGVAAGLLPGGGSGNGGATAQASLAGLLLPRPGAAGIGRELAVMPPGAILAPPGSSHPPSSQHQHHGGHHHGGHHHPQQQQQQGQQQQPMEGAGVASAVAVVPPLRHAVSRELQVYFDRVAALLDAAGDADAEADDAAAAAGGTSASGGPSAPQPPPTQNQAAAAAMLRAALVSLGADPGLHPLAPYFAAYVADGVAGAVATDARRLGRMLDLAGALLSNPAVHLEPYLSQVLPALMTALLTRRIGAPPAVVSAAAAAAGGGPGGAGGANNKGATAATAAAARSSEGGDPCHWQLRDRAAALVARACARYGAPHLGVRPRVARLLARAFADPSKAELGLGLKYGAVKGLAALGSEAVRAVLIPHCEALVTGTLLPRMRAAGDGGGEGGGNGGADSTAPASAAAAAADAWRVYAALRDAIAATMRDWFERLAADRVEGGRGRWQGGGGGGEGGGEGGDEEAKAAALAAGAAARAVAMVGAAAAKAAGGGGDSAAMDVDETEGAAAAAAAAAQSSSSSLPPEHRRALARAWRDDADPRAVLDALVALFGAEAMLAAMPGADELPGVFL